VLGLDHTITLPEEALLYRAAVGHISVGAEEPYPAPAWMLPRAVGPAGLITAAARDGLAFARMHLTGGLARDGTRVLSEASAREMTQMQAELPNKHALGDSWGLGWIRFGWQGRRLIGHDGNTAGQSAFLRLLPEEGLAVTLLTNGGNAGDLYQDLYREIFAELAELDMPRPLVPPSEPVQLEPEPYSGTYKRESALVEVLTGDDGPVLRVTNTGPLAHLNPEPTKEYAMVAVEPDLFLIREPQVQTWTPLQFYQLPTGERYLHFRSRANPKVG
jgi:hypothetical protein